jgi:hypothetical protein
VDGIVHSTQWLNSEFRFVRTSDPTFRDVADVLHSELVPMTLGQLKEFWENQNYLFWQSDEYNSLGHKVYDFETSVSYAEEFLIYQFNGSDVFALQLLKYLQILTF